MDDAVWQKFGPLIASLLHRCALTRSLQLAWWLERAARLAFLRRTDEVEAEWRLERKQRPPGSLTLELAALLLLSWQAVDLWLAL